MPAKNPKKKQKAKKKAKRKQPEKGALKDDDLEKISGGARKAADGLAITGI